MGRHRSESAASSSSSNSQSPPPPSPSPLTLLLERLPFPFTKREQLFVGLLFALLILFNVVLTDLAATLQFLLLNGALVYVAYQLAPLLYNSLHFIEKEQISAKGKAVLITGCDTGFGHQLAKRLVARGFYVFAGCLNGSSEGAQTLRSSYRTDDQLLVVPLDVTSEESVAAAKAIVEEKLASSNSNSSGSKKGKGSSFSNSGLGLWSVVNNAGVLSLLEIELGDMTPFTRQMEINCFGLVRVTKAFLPVLRRNRLNRGRVVNVASLAGRFTMPGFVAYCMSKGAVITFSDGLRREAAKWGIEVVCVEPHLYKTNLVNRERLSADYEAGWQATPEDARADYGHAYFEGFKRTMETALETARDATEQVVDTLERSVAQEVVEPYYVVLKHIERVRIWFFATLAPTALIDLLMCKALTNGNGTPARLLLKAE